MTMKMRPGAVRCFGAAALAALLAGCASAATPTPQIIYVTPAPTVAPTPAAATPTPTSEMYKITGTITTPGMPDLNGDGRCAYMASPEYDDVNAGTGIVVFDESDKTIATAALPAVQKIPLGKDQFPCRWAFTITVPKAAFYHVKIGRRDGPTDSFDAMKAAGWKWDLSLGL